MNLADEVELEVIKALGQVPFNDRTPEFITHLRLMSLIKKLQELKDIKDIKQIDPNTVEIDGVKYHKEQEVQVEKVLTVEQIYNKVKPRHYLNYEGTLKMSAYSDFDESMANIPTEKDAKKVKAYAQLITVVSYLNKKYDRIDDGGWYVILVNGELIPYRRINVFYPLIINNEEAVLESIEIAKEQWIDFLS